MAPPAAWERHTPEQHHGRLPQCSKHRQCCRRCQCSRSGAARGGGVCRTRRLGRPGGSGATASDEGVGDAGGSEGRSRCDDRLFTVLQEQHKRGLLRAAGTEDLFRNVSRRKGQGAPRKHPPAAAADAAMTSTTAAAAPAVAPGGAHVADQGGEGVAEDANRESSVAGAGCASAVAREEAAVGPADGAGPPPACAIQVRAAESSPLKSQPCDL